MTSGGSAVEAQWQQWVDDPGLVSFYASHRNDPADLYPSERRFLPWLAAHASFVLDVGCATGGFLDIWRHFNPTISYSGVDVSSGLVEYAQAAHPGIEFTHGDCAAGLSLPDRSSEVVQALGWLHWEPRYRAALGELWRLAGRWLFFDLRLVELERDLDEGRQVLSFTGSQLGKSTPYICCSWPRFAELLLELRPATVMAHGYWGKPAESVSGVEQNVCFVTFVLERADAARPSDMEVALEAPLSWPEAFDRDVQRLPEGCLAERIPIEGD